MCGDKRDFIPFIYQHTYEEKYFSLYLQETVIFP